jgi:trans-aconitate 2-methyltransferase
MSSNPGKDFEPIAEDYAFFESHATEAEEDARAYLESLGKILPADGDLRMLDFGCGSGTFTERLLQMAGWPRERLRLTLVEPVESARRKAAAQLAGFTAAPIVAHGTLTDGLTGDFEVILANHVLYYVADLPGQLTRLIGLLSDSGVFLTAIAPRTNALIKFWIAAFGWLGREVPYHTSEDVETALQKLGADYQKHSVAYELTFPDTPENRQRIIRFLLADHLSQLPLERLFALFDRYSTGGRINVQTASDHFTIRRA